MDSDDEILSADHIYRLSELSGATEEHWRNNSFYCNSFEFSLNTSPLKHQDDEPDSMPETPKFTAKEWTLKNP